MRVRALVLPAAVVVVGFQALNLVGYYSVAEKEPWRALIAETRANAPDGAALIYPSGPYLVSAITTLVLGRYYWPGAETRAEFVTPPEHAANLHRGALKRLPTVRVLAPSDLCASLGATGHVVMIHRRADHAAELRAALEALGSAPLTEIERGMLGSIVLTGPDCARG